MNKLMVIATLVAGMVMNTTASECNETPCQFGYGVKIMVRTTNPCAVQDTSCGPCGETYNYRKPAIRRFVGMIYGVSGQKSVQGKCGEVTTCACNTWKDTANVALWDYETKMPVNIDSAELLQLNRVGCEAAERNKAEMTFALTLKCGNDTYPVMFSGFGLCGNHDNNYTIGSIQGYCAGLIPAGRSYMNGCSETGFCSTKMWSICENTAIDCAYTSAYGKWTMNWDSGIASKVGSNLTSTSAKTSYGTATPVLLKDARMCDCPCAD